MTTKLNSIEKILGPSLLSSAGKVISTRSAIAGDFILLYFAASWCPPCRDFTPILSEFYKTCAKPRKVEIIFISSDFDADSFENYYANIPFKALPTDRESLKIKQRLFYSLQISILPTVVVMDTKTGYIIKGNVKSAIENVADDKIKGKELINSWNIIKSDTKDSLTNVVKDKNDSKVMPTFLLIEFLKVATSKLSSHPGREIIKKWKSLQHAKNRIIDPVPVINHRKDILQIQLKSLKNTISDYNEANHRTFSLDRAQLCLRELGAKNLKGITGSVEEKEKLLSDMAEMNEAARLAFARSVLRAETEWEKKIVANNQRGLIDGEIARKLRTSNDGKGFMEKSALVQFCGLMSSALRLEEVIIYLRNGGTIFPKEGKDDDTNNSKMKSPPQKRILQIQNALIRSIGYSSSFGLSEIRRMITLMSDGQEKSTNNEDKEVYRAVENFLVSMRDASTKALREPDLTNTDLSDKKEGGVTSVIGVKYSEKIMTPDGKITSLEQDGTESAEMEHQSDARQRQALKVAKQTADIQHNVLEELLNMSEKERTDTLAKAKIINDNFLREAQQIASGTERIRFIQNVDEEKQKALIMHKVWEQMMSNQINED